MLSTAAASPALAAGTPVASPVIRMSAAEFLARIDAYEAQGVNPPPRAERDPLAEESKGIVYRWYDDRDRGKGTGRTDLGCFDFDRGQFDLKAVNRDWLTAIRALPPERRRSTTAEAVFRQVVSARYPCR